MQPATSALLTAEQVLISASKTQMTFQEIQGRESTKLERYRVRITGKMRQIKSGNFRQKIGLLSDRSIDGWITYPNWSTFVRALSWSRDPRKSCTFGPTCSQATFESTSSCRRGCSYLRTRRLPSSRRRRRRRRLQRLRSAPLSKRRRWGWNPHHGTRHTAHRHNERPAYRHTGRTARTSSTRSPHDLRLISFDAGLLRCREISFFTTAPHYAMCSPFCDPYLTVSRARSE